MSKTQSPEEATKTGVTLGAALPAAPASIVLTPVLDEPRKLDDVLLAMDVVDTLRHREALVRVELDEEAREAELIQRLKDIYHAQGIDVPERILKDGVRALQEQRFLYKPRTKGLPVALARLYVNRSKWMPLAGAAIGVIIAALFVWQFVFVQPTASDWRRLPVEISRLAGSAQALATEEGVDARIASIAQEGENAVERRDRNDARDAVKQLEVMNNQLASEYDLRVVSLPGEDSGFYRTPPNTPMGRNYYIIVEPVSPGGKVLRVPVVNEETNQQELVSKWAQRVSEDTFNRVSADKAPDQIVQNDLIGHKSRRELEPKLEDGSPGGAITQW